MKIMKVAKWAGIALAAGLAATSVEIVRNKNRCDYVRQCIFDQHDAASQQNHAASARKRQNREMRRDMGGRHKQRRLVCLAPRR